MDECGKIYSITVHDSQTLIPNVLIGYAKQKYIVYDPIWKCLILFEKTIIPEQLNSIDAIKIYLKGLNRLLDIDTWAKNGSTMPALFVYLNNLYCFSEITREVYVYSIRQKLIESPRIVKPVSTNNNNNNNQQDNNQKLNHKVAEFTPKKRKKE